MNQEAEGSKKAAKEKAEVTGPADACAAKANAVVANRT
jgi:hypothetical protein